MASDLCQSLQRFGSQFVTGLLAKLKSKVVGREGKMDELVVKARFEEAKSKELGTPKPHPT